MGGTIFVGIREEDGTEHLLHTWTNALPWVLAAPSFYNKGEVWNDLFKRCDDPKSIYSRRLKRLNWRGTYGYVIVDMREKIILSRNSYFYPGSFSFSGCDANDFAELREMAALGWITRVYDMRDKADAEAFWEDKAPQDTPGALKKLLDATPGGDYRNRISFCPTGYVISHICEQSPRASAKVLRKFMADYGWKAK